MVLRREGRLDGESAAMDVDDEGQFRVRPLRWREVYPGPNPVLRRNNDVFGKDAGFQML